MKIPFNDLSRQYITIQPEINRAIHRVLHKGMFILGDEVRVFEQEFSEFLEENSENSEKPDHQITQKYLHAVGVGSGTDALTLAMKALGLGKGDEVIMPANSYPSVFGIAISGVTVRLVDVDANGLLNPEKIPSVISRKTRAIVPVHLYGNPCDVFRIQNILKRYSRKIYIIEDCAQSVGARIEYPISNDKSQTRLQSPTAIVVGGQVNTNKQMTNYRTMRQNDTKNTVNRSFPSKSYKLKVKSYTTGTIGDIGCFSFYPTKNLGAYGDGGMVVTRDPEVADRLRQLRMYGEVSRYKSMRISGVSRLDELQAAILRVKLKHLNSWTEKRRMIAKEYFDYLSQNNSMSVLTNDSFFQMSNYYSVFHLFVVRTQKRDQLQEYLKKKGIGSAIHYPYPIHLTSSFRDLGYKKGDFPVSELLSKQVLSLPIFPELKQEETNAVVNDIAQFNTH